MMARHGGLEIMMCFRDGAGRQKDGSSGEMGTRGAVA